MTKNKYFLIILMIFLLFIIPATSANDNTTDIIEIDNGDSISDDNLLNENVGNTENILSDASPHKELTDDDLKNDSKIYLTNGEYDYKQNTNTETLHLSVKTHQILSSTVTEAPSI